MVNVTITITTWRTWHNVLSPGKYMWRQGLDMVLASSVQMTEPAHHKRLTSLHRHFTSRQRPTRNLGWNTPPAIGASSQTNIRCLRGVYETIKGCPKGSSTLAKKFCTALAMAFPDFFGRGESTCRSLNSAHWKGPQYKGTIRTEGHKAISANIQQRLNSTMVSGREGFWWMKSNAIPNHDTCCT